MIFGMKNAPAVLIIAALMLAGCKSYQTFPESRAKASEALRLLGDQGQLIHADDPDEFRAERFRYIQTVQERIADVDQVRMTIMMEKWSANDARILDVAIASVYDHMIVLARLPARLKEDGTPADEGTADLLEAADDAVTSLALP